MKRDPFAISVNEAAELLGISTRLVETLLARGEFPVVRFGRRVVVPMRALEEWLTRKALDSIGSEGDRQNAQLAVAEGEARTSGRHLPAG